MLYSCSMLRLNLGGYLKRHGLTPYRLVKESGLAQATVYNMARTPAQRVDLDTVGTLLDALRRMTGERVKVDDLLEYTPAEAAQPGPGEVQAGQALLIPPGKRSKARGLSSPVPVEGPAIEELLNEQAGPEA